MTTSQSMVDALNDLEAAFTEVNHPWVDHTTPGLAVDQIQDEASNAGLILPDELVELWAWRSTGDLFDDQQNGWMLPGEFQIPTLQESIKHRSSAIENETLDDSWYMKTSWIIALKAGPIEFWAETAAGKTGAVPVTPVDLWDSAGCEQRAPDRTVPITTVIRDMARMLREGHWGLYENPYTTNQTTMWMRNPEIGDITDNELGYTWAYPT